jgi:acyl-CoA reductase-like NAD-dependent aldehyde dehydrogenase
MPNPQSRTPRVFDTRSSILRGRSRAARSGSARRPRGDTSEFRKTSREERIALIQRIVEEHQKRLPDFAESVSEETGAPILLAGSAQAQLGLNSFRAIVAIRESVDVTDRRGNTRVAESHASMSSPSRTERDGSGHGLMGSVQTEAMTCA